MFIQPDWFDVRDPGVGTNRFAYSFNDPVNLRDPGGNWVSTNRDIDGDGAPDGFIGQAKDVFGMRGKSGTQLDFEGFSIAALHDMVDGFVAGSNSGGISGNQRVTNSKYLSYRWVQTALRNCRGFCAKGLKRISKPLDGFFKNTLRNLPTKIEKAIISARLSRTSVQDAMLRSANSQFTTGKFSNAGRALTKHPNIVGLKTPQELSKVIGNQGAINRAAHQAITEFMKTGTRTVKDTKAFGKVVDFKAPSGLGVRFSATSYDFIGFLGRGVP